jgi:hypothetical protein
MMQLSKFISPMHVPIPPNPIAVAIAMPSRATAAVALNYADWNRARPWLNEKISAALERQFEIRGPVSLAWQRQGHWLPLPHLWPRRPPRQSARHGGRDGQRRPVGVCHRAAALLRQRIEIPQLRFDNPALLLQRDADGQNNWTFKRDDQPRLDGGGAPHRPHQRHGALRRCHDPR